MLKNYTIETRLRLGAGAMLLLLFIVGLSALFGIIIINNDVGTLVQDKWPKTVMLDEMRNQVSLVTIAMDTALLTNDPALRQEELKQVAKSREEITKLLELLRERVTSSEGMELLKKIETTRAEYLAEQLVVLKLIRNGAKEKATTLVVGKLRQAQSAYLAAVSEMGKFQDSAVEQHGVHANNTVKFALKAVPALLLGAAFLLALITRIISNGITVPVNACVTAANKIAAGDFSVILDSTANDEAGHLQEAMARMIDAIKRLISDTDMLTQAATAGELTTRANPTRHRGEFRTVVVGINETLDAIVGPLNVAAEYVERIAKGTIPPMITDPYHGDFLEIKNNLNGCIAIMNNLLAETFRVIQAANADNLDERADAELFSGNWKKLVTGVNTIITTIVNPLKQATEQLHVEIDERRNSQRQLEELNVDLAARVSAEVMRSRERDRAILQSEKMATLGLLAAGVAHEINNPMGYIASNLRMLREYFEKINRLDKVMREICINQPHCASREAIARITEELDMEYLLRDGIDLITESLDGAEQVKNIVLEMKNFSRMDTEEKQLMAINDCPERARTIAHNELKHVATMRVEYVPVPEILCHPGQLNQVFLNLLVNAGQAMVAPGEIVMKCWHDDAFVYASVSDTGGGIPEELRARIFDPFFTTKEVDKGTGLGLSISNEIIKKHDGEIMVESVVGVGTTFTVKLPLTP